MEREVFRGEGEVFRDYYYTTSPPAPLAWLADFPAVGGAGPGRDPENAPGRGGKRKGIGTRLGLSVQI